MEDIAYLVSESYISTDAEGNRLQKRNLSQVFCKIQSVTRKEYYDAATQDIAPELDMTISHTIDYDNQEMVMYHGVLYDIIRVYWRGDAVSLTLARRAGTVEDQEAILIMPDGSPVIFADKKELTINY